MTKTVAEARFDAARRSLAASFANLEETIKRKIHEASISAPALDTTSNDGLLRARIVEQEAIIQNLNSEINNLQKNLSELGKETEFLNEKNKILAEKIAEFRKEKSNLVTAIETELTGIEEAIIEEGASS